MTELPSEYKKRCFKDIDSNPIHGLYGYILYKNISKYSMEQKLKIDIQGAEIIWPQEVVEFERFKLETEPESYSLILFRKLGDGEVSTSIEAQNIPRKLTSKEITSLVRKSEKIVVKEGSQSYF